MIYYFNNIVIYHDTQCTRSTNGSKQKKPIIVEGLVQSMNVTIKKTQQNTHDKYSTGHKPIYSKLYHLYKLERKKWPK